MDTPHFVGEVGQLQKQQIEKMEKMENFAVSRTPGERGRKRAERPQMSAVAASI